MVKRFSPHCREDCVDGIDTIGKVATNHYKVGISWDKVGTIPNDIGINYDKVGIYVHTFDFCTKS